MWNLPNYTGEIYCIGANQTPFLSMMGGLTGKKIWTVKATDYFMALPWELESPYQYAITEAASMTAPTPISYVRWARPNTTQIFHKSVSVSYLKESVGGSVMADPGTTLAQDGDQPIKSELDFQISANLKQLAIDLEYTFLHGEYQQAYTIAWAAKTGGVITGCTSNVIAAGGAILSKPLLEALFRTMANTGAVFVEPVLFCSAFNKQRISGIYGYAPEHRNIGGVNIKQIVMDWGNVGVAWAPQIDDDTIAVVDVAFCRPVYLPVPEKGVLFYETLSKTGAGETGQIYGQIGLDYGPEEYHGKITGLATSY